MIDSQRIVVFSFSIPTGPVLSWGFGVHKTSTCVIAFTVYVHIYSNFLSIKQNEFILVQLFELTHLTQSNGFVMQIQLFIDPYDSGHIVNSKYQFSNHSTLEVL